MAFEIPIEPASRSARLAARERIDQLTKPQGSLGRVEEIAERLAAIAGGLPTTNYERRVVLIGAGDHGVTVEGVSAYPSEVTGQMLHGYLAQSAAINAFARAVRAEVFVANFGVASDVPDAPNLFNAPIARGTRNFAREPALSPREVDEALHAGATIVRELQARTQMEILALGEMGIGNTTSAAALVCGLTGESPAGIAGRGTGVDDAGLARKIAAVERGVARCARGSWESCASEVGGLEIVGLAGAMLAAAQQRIPILLDGFIVGAAALLAYSISPNVVEYCFASHRSCEQGHAFILRALGLTPLFDLNLRLGEGTGAALAFPLIEAAARMIREMKTFAEAGVATAT